MKTSWSQYRAILATYLKPLWRQSDLPAVLLGGTGLKLLNPQILGNFIDTAIAGGSLVRHSQLAFLFLSLAVTIQFPSVAETYLATNIGLRATNQLRADLTLHCLPLDLCYTIFRCLSIHWVITHRTTKHLGLLI